MQEVVCSQWYLTEDRQWGQSNGSIDCFVLQRNW